jgi:hypothetical protein
MGRRQSHPTGNPGRCPPLPEHSWVPKVARNLCSPDVVLVVLLRDPVERFASAMRMKLGRTKLSPTVGFTQLHLWSRLHGADAQWGGMYTTQLAAWDAVFERRHLVVLHYEWGRCLSSRSSRPSMVGARHRHSRPSWDRHAQCYLQQAQRIMVLGATSRIPRNAHRAIRPPSRAPPQGLEHRPTTLAQPHVLTYRAEHRWRSSMIEYEGLL